MLRRCQIGPQHIGQFLQLAGVGLGSLSPPLRRASNQHQHHQGRRPAQVYCTNMGCLLIFVFCFPDQATILAAQGLASLHNQQNAGGTTFCRGHQAQFDSSSQAAGFLARNQAHPLCLPPLAPSVAGREPHCPHHVSRVGVKGKVESQFWSGTPPIHPLPHLDVG
jgi:Rieske Fe-S protein